MREVERWHPRLLRAERPHRYERGGQEDEIAAAALRTRGRGGGSRMGGGVEEGVASRGASRASWLDGLRPCRESGAGRER